MSYDGIYIHREVEKVLRHAVDQFPALALTGPRQSGKSTLAKKIFGKTHNIVSFDNPITREQAISDPKFFIKSAGKKIVFDEIQYVPQILSYIKILIDEDRHNYGRFIITGSQQFHLIKNIGDSLAGRIALFDLLPFSIDEKKKIAHLRNKISDTENEFEHACLRGSYPEIALRSNIDFNAWYGSYLQTYLERDIRTTYNVGILRQFQQFMRLLAGRCSQILNLSTFANDLGISVNTIKKWLSILEASRIIYILPPYYRNLGKRVTKSPKIYFLDIGLICYLTGLKSRGHLFNGPLTGALFENFVIQETVKYFLNKGIRPKLYYLRTHNQAEIDLIIEKNFKLYPFEIKATRTPNFGMAKQVERSKQIFSKLKFGSGKIVCFSEQEILFTSDISTANVDSYLKSLETFVS
jgi:predicted AAA+ superfamily ATPase